jgi:hypothetical protein
MNPKGAFAMAMTDADVLKKLRELRASKASAAGAVPKKPQQSATAGAPKGKPKRRSDAEVAHAVLMLDIALSSPSFQAALGGGTKSAAAVAAALPDSSFCKIYNEVKDYIEIVVDALDWIPVPYAATIQKVVRLLEKFANRACKR